MNQPFKLNIDSNIIREIADLIEEGEKIIKNGDTCEAVCWLDKSEYIMSLNWDVILTYQGMRLHDIARLLDGLAIVTLKVMDTRCSCT